MKGAELSDCTEYATKVQFKCKINMHLEPLDTSHATETELIHPETFWSQSSIPVIDQFVLSLRKRLEAFRLVDTHPGFLRKLDSVTVNEEIMTAAQSFVEAYGNDLDNNLRNELP